MNTLKKKSAPTAVTAETQEAKAPKRDYLTRISAEVSSANAGDTYEISGRTYPVDLYIKNSATGKFDIPRVGMRMMSDEDWVKHSRENAIHNYTKKFGHPPETAEIAVEWQREFCAEFIRKCEEDDVAKRAVSNG